MLGKLDLRFSHVLAQTQNRAISEVKCFSHWVICKDGGSDRRTFFSLQVVNRGSSVIVIPHNVELCKQYFLQECLYC